MSALSCWVTCGMHVPRVAEVLRRLAADVAHRLALDFSPLAEIGQRRGRDRRAARQRGRDGRARHDTLDVLLEVLDADPAAVPAAGDLADVDAQLTRHPADGRRRRSRGPPSSRPAAAAAGADGCGPRPPRLMSTTSPRFGFGAVVGRRVSASPSPRSSCARSRPRAGRVGVRRRLLAHAALFGGAGRLRLRRRPRLRHRRLAWPRPWPADSSAGSTRAAAAPPPSTVSTSWPDLDLVARLDLDLLDRACDVGRHFDRGLVGLEFEDRLVFRERVARLHQHADDVAGGDVLAQFGNLEFSSPVSSTVSGKPSAQSFAGILLVRVDPEVLDGLRDDLAARSRRSARAPRAWPSAM